VIWCIYGFPVLPHVYVSDIHVITGPIVYGIAFLSFLKVWSVSPGVVTKRNVGKW
jgi:hypothetical protein